MTIMCNNFVAIVPAAGVGKRMQTRCPKQYLMIENKTILEHTVDKLLSHPLVTHVVIAISAGDEYFKDSALSSQANITVVQGGAERVNSVLAGLLSVNLDEYPWVMVHDAARPCVELSDITQLINDTQQADTGGLLAYPVRDTMKKSLSVNAQSTNANLTGTQSKSINSAVIHSTKNNSAVKVKQTIERKNLWHALTPQLYKTEELILAITKALNDKVTITDESSAIEYAGFESLLVEGNSNNIKITRPDDLLLANFIFSQQNNTHLSAKVSSTELSSKELNSTEVNTHLATHSNKHNTVKDPLKVKKCV